MITRTNAFKTDAGVFDTLEEAQRAEIEEMLEHKNAGVGSSAAWTPEEIAHWMVEEKARLLDVLTTTPTSKARARKVNGGKKTRNAFVDKWNKAVNAADATANANLNAALQDSKQ